MKKKAKLPIISASITNWNGKDYCLDCLKSISKLNYPRKLLDVMVVDNASSDGSVEAIKKKYPWVRVFLQNKNIGFTAGMNVGLRNARGKYTLILNNDEILEKDSVLELVKAAETSNKIAMAGAKVYSMDYPKQIQCMWGNLDKKTMHVDRIGLGEEDHGQYEDIVEADYVSFPSIIRNNALKKIGYLDERYFYGFEDVDIMIRLKEAGYKLVFVPKAKIWHKGAVAFGVNTPKSIYFLERNNLLARKKFNGMTLMEHYKNMRFMISCLLLALIGQKDQRSLNLAVVKAIFDFYFNRFGAGSFQS